MKDLNYYFYFWSALSCVAATLAGFTLASYGIYTTRIEMAAADEICRRYAFKEYTSRFSWSFIIIAIVLLLLPLAEGLLKLVPVHVDVLHEVVPLAQGLIAACAFSLLGFIGWMIVLQVRYLGGLLLYDKRVKQALRAAGRTDRLPSRWKRVGTRLKLVFLALLLFLALPVLAANLALVVLILDPRGIWLPGLKPFAAIMPVELAACASLVLGVLLVCLHFVVFQPPLFLFRIDDGTKRMLRETRGQIEPKCQSLRLVRDWLKYRIRRAHKMFAIDPASASAEALQAKELLERALSYVEGRDVDPETGRSYDLLERMPYHIGQLEFLEGLQSANHEGLIASLTSVDLYLAGLKRFEGWLKEIPDLLEHLEQSLALPPCEQPAQTQVPDTSSAPIMIGISVVTPTHGRRHLVATLLESLQAARIGADMQSEVLIVDSSGEEDARVIQEACEKLDVRYLSHPVNNVREKRNLGVREARFPVVLFVDSDCTVSPDLLIEHARGYRDGVGGVVGVTRFVGPANRTWRLIEKTSVLDSFSYAARMETAPWGPTCNISYRKDVLEQVHGFDESFPFRLGGDDVDLGLRVTDAGHAIRCNPAAVVEHTRETWSDLRLIGRRLFRWGRMHHHLMLKHPQRRLIDFPKTMGVFFLLALALMASALIGLRPWLLLLLPLWLALDLLLEAAFLSRLSAEGRRGFGAHLGGRLLGLLFELGTLIEGARHGSMRPFYQEIYYAPPSPNSSGRSRRAVQVWASLLALLVLLPVLVGFL